MNAQAPNKNGQLVNAASDRAIHRRSTHNQMIHPTTTARVSPGAQRERRQRAMPATSPARPASAPVMAGYNGPGCNPT